MPAVLCLCLFARFLENLFYLEVLQAGRALSLMFDPLCARQRVESFVLWLP